jgi:hypothetical protein
VFSFRLLFVSFLSPSRGRLRRRERWVVSVRSGDPGGSLVIQKEEEILMSPYKLAAAFTLSFLLVGPSFAQTNVEQTKQTQEQLKKEHKADKAQAKADKAEAKALKSKKQKKADKAQDKADREADKTATPPQ